MKDDRNQEELYSRMPLATLLDMASIRPTRRFDSSGSGDPRSIPRANLIACIEEALRIIDDDLNDDGDDLLLWEDTSDETSASSSSKSMDDDQEPRQEDEQKE